MMHYAIEDHGDVDDEKFSFWPGVAVVDGG